MTTQNQRVQKIKSIIDELELLKNSGKYWNISYTLGEKLSEIISKEKPSSILEIGTSNGFSTLWIAKALNEKSKITTIEVNEERFLQAKSNLKKAGIANITQIQGEVFDLIENEKITGKFDFVFLDAAQRMYLFLIKKLEKFNLLADNFTLVADNVLSHSNMEEFISYMNSNYDCEILEVDSGFLIARKKKLFS